jgi:hypothetical protein
LKERTLKRLIQTEDDRKQLTKATETKLTSIQKHFSKDNQRLGHEFSTVVNKLSCLGNSSAINESEMHGLESLSFERPMMQNFEQKGPASIRFNNSVAAKFEKGREEEVNQALIS